MCYDVLASWRQNINYCDSIVGEDCIKAIMCLHYCIENGDSVMKGQSPYPLWEMCLCCWETGRPSDNVVPSLERKDGGPRVPSGPGALEWNLAASCDHASQAAYPMLPSSHQDSCRAPVHAL